MCASCVAQSTPMVVAGFGLLRRRALMSWVRTLPHRREAKPIAEVPAAPPRS